MMLTIFIMGSISFTSQTKSQDVVKRAPETQSYYTIGSDPVTATLTSIQEESLLKELREARLSNNKDKVNELQSKFNEMHGITPVPMGPSGPMPVLVSAPHNEGGPFEQDYMTSPITLTSQVWSIATATVPVGAPNAGRLWAAYTSYAAGTDTLWIRYSDNGGATWNAYSGFLYPSTNIDYRSNELDLEVIYDGTSVWVFGVAGLVDASSQLRCNFFRFNTTTFSFYSTILAWPGAVANNGYYNPRITSDESIYGGGAFVYILASFDTADGSSRHCRQKFAYTTSPLAAAPTISYPQANAGGFWWHTTVPAGSYYHGDIAYFSNSGVDRIITVANFPTTVAFPSMYLAWSDNYGTSNTGSLTITEPVANITFGARIAYNGGSTSNRNGMITYTRLFGGTDWDPYYRRTTNGGSTTGDWTGDYIDASTNRARYTDVIAIRGAAGLFKSGYIQDITGGYAAYYTGWGGTSWNSPTGLIVNNIACDSTFGKVRAGYRNGGGDDCLAIWSSANNNVYSSRLCQTTVGIGNKNQIPSVYSLSQNYPNPFNPTTNISFSIPRQGMVKLVVYDVIGKEVATLVNEVKQAGEYNLSFDASKIPSGVYFYKLTSGSFVDTKKMVLVK
jgi:hypothetical protein